MVGAKPHRRRRWRAAEPTGRADRAREFLGTAAPSRACDIRHRFGLFEAQRCGFRMRPWAMSYRACSLESPTDIIAAFRACLLEPSTSCLGFILQINYLFILQKKKSWLGVSAAWAVARCLLLDGKMVLKELDRKIA